MAAQGLTAVLASLFGAAMTSALAPSALLSWGWRVPFVFGMLIIPVAIYIRRNVEETPIFKARERISSPVIETFSQHKANLVLAILTYVLNTASSYVIVLFMPTFAVKQLGLDSTIAFVGTLLIGAIQIFACPLFGALSDRCGRLQTLAAAALLNGLIAISCFAWLTAAPANVSFIVACLLLGVSISAFQGPMPAALSEIFPSGIRSTGLALTHNLTVAMFGGFAPFIVTWGIVKTGSGLVPGVYMAVAATISFVAIICYISLRRQTSLGGSSAQQVDRLSET
jgi:MHS family proline/betaine transporter-like MFS transporter